MADIFPAKKRSEIMSRIRSKDTLAETIVFRELRRDKIYFQKHYRRAPGKPDIALPSKKKAVFIDGDFWHGRDFERMAKDRPESDFWIKKLTYNMDRDKKQLKELGANGWLILRIWESDILRKRTQQKELEKIKKFLNS